MDGVPEPGLHRRQHMFVLCGAVTRRRHDTELSQPSGERDRSGKLRGEAHDPRDVVVLEVAVDRPVVGSPHVRRILCATLSHAEVGALQMHAEDLCALARGHGGSRYSQQRTMSSTGAVAMVASSAVTPRVACSRVTIANASMSGSLKEWPRAPCVWMSIRPGAM